MRALKNSERQFPFCYRKDKHCPLTVDKITFIATAPWRTAQWSSACLFESGACKMTSTLVCKMELNPDVVSTGCRVYCAVCPGLSLSPRICRLPFSLHCLVKQGGCSQCSRSFLIFFYSFFWFLVGPSLLYHSARSYLLSGFYCIFLAMTGLKRGRE